MRPLVYEFQNDEKVFDESFEFMFGKGILVANVLEEGQETKPVYLPKGSKWYDFNNNYRCCEGGQIIEIPVDRTSIPMFIREGAVIPIALNQPKNMERDKVTDLKLIVAPGRETAGFTLYDDDGVSNDFRKGAYKKTEITVSGTKVINMEFRISGDYDDPVDHLLVEIIRKDRAPFFVELGDRRLEPFLNRVKFEQASEGWYYSHTKKAVEVKYPNPRKNYVLSVSFEKFDLIEM